MLSIGLGPDDNPRGNYPVKLDHFRAKPGQLEQYAAAAAKFEKVYGPEPKVVDVIAVSDEIRDVFDVRPKVWGTSGLKAMGVENLAELDEDEFQERLYSFTEDLIVYPDDNPTPAAYKLTGRDDPVVAKLGCKVYGVFRFAIPQVTGLATLCEISTTSTRSILNLHAGLKMARKITGGRIIGVPMVLIVRPARTRYFDEKEKRRRTSEFYELVLDTPGSLTELYEGVQARRAALEVAPLKELPPAEIRHDDRERDAESIVDHDEAIVEGIVEVLPRVVPDEPVDVDADEPAADSLFQAPTGPRGSKA